MFNAKTLEPLLNQAGYRLSSSCSKDHFQWERCDQLGIRQPQASKHLRVLAESGLVEVRPEAQRRVYALRAQPLRELDLWLRRYRRLWEEQFERLDQVLEELQARQKSTKENTKAVRRRRSKAKPR